MVAAAAAADRRGRWGVARGVELVPSDDLIYDRFGPAYSDVTFSWHCDDSPQGPRDISVVAYFTPPGEYEGGELQIKLDADAAAPAAAAPPQSAASSLAGADGEAAAVAAPAASPQAAGGGAAAPRVVRRIFPAGATVAFPSKTLEHRVTPVTSGHRRSLLLLCRRANGGGHGAGLG